MIFRPSPLRLTAGFALGVVLAAAASALAGSTEAKVAGVGGAEIKWNDVRYRKQLVDQIQPGMTWRLGAGGATRLEVTGMVLAADGGLLFPGEATLNLRFVTADTWNLVAYEENEWRWEATRHHSGVMPCTVWREKDPKKAAEKLTLALRGATGKTLAAPPAAEAVTGGGGTEAKPAKPEMTSPVAYSKEARAELDKAPWLELEMRFGDLVGLVAFEAAEAGEIKAKKADESKTPITLRWPQFTAVRAKTELVETGTDVTLGWLRIGTEVAGESLLVVGGGEHPELEMRKIGADGGSKTVQGTRTATKTTPKTIAWECDGKTLTLHLHQADYTFVLP